MKTRYLIFLAFSVLVLGPAAWAQRALPATEHFDYNAGELRSVGTDWTRISGTANDLNVVDGNLSYTGYQMPATGRQVRTLSTGADDDKLTFTSQSTAGTKIYASFILNVIDTLGLTTAGAYFVILGNGTTNFATRLYIRKVSGSNVFNLGLAKNSTTVSVWSGNISVASEHLIVIDYEIVTGTANDTIRAWIDPALSGGQPAPAMTSYSTGGDLTIDGFFIRQAAGNPNSYIDGLRIGLSWADIDPAVSGGSDVSDGAGTEPASVSALMDSDAEKVLNFDFRVKDDSTGGDALNTLIDKIVITKGTGNDVANWTAVVAGAKLFDGSADSATGAVYADSLVFSGIDHSSGKLGEVTDNSSKTYQLKLWLKSDLGSLKTTIDNGNLAFKVDRASFTADAAGTPFASGAGTAVESGSSNNSVSVTATKLSITTQPPASVDVAVDFSLSVEAADSNGNRDLNASNSTTLTLLGGTGNLTAVSGLTQNLSSGIRTWSDLQYDLAETGLGIEASASGLTPDTTITFSAIGGAPTVQASSIVFSEVSENQLIISWTNGNGSARIVLIQEGSAVDSDPLDGVSYYPSSTYLMGQEVGAGNYTVYSASGNCDTILGLAPNTTYHFAVYEYNGSGGTENYLTLNPAVGSQLTTEHFDTGDYRSLKTGNWTDLTAWETYNGTAWGAPSQPPCSTNNILIRSTDTITVVSDASCKNAVFLGASFGTRLDIGNYTLAVHGILNADGVTLNDYLIRSNTGKLKFVGGQRALFGENWGAYGTRWRMEVALTSGDTGSSTKNIKASDIIISSGVFKGQDVRADSGTASTGTLTVNAGAALIARSISRTSTATAPCRKVTVNGTLAMTGSNISGDSILINNGAYLRSSSVSGQIITGILQYASSATLEYAAAAAQHTKHELQPSVPNIVINTPAGVTMDTSSTVINSLTMTSGSLNTGADSLILGSSATMTGEQAGRYVIGKLLTSKTVGTGSSSLGGIGVTLNSGTDDLGTVNVSRISGPAGQVVASITGASADTGIARKWIISSANPPSAGRDLGLSWVSDDDNGRTLNAAQLWKSTDGGASWAGVGPVVDASSSRTITQTVYSFSQWTVSDAANPLPVQLSHFAATAATNGIIISWRTESECQAYQWLVERSSGVEEPYQTVARLQAQGPSGQPQEYTWTDDQAMTGQKYYYRLGQILTDGKTVYYGPVQAGLVSSSLAGDILLTNTPNPFTQSTLISYLVGQVEKDVSLNVYNISGQLVKTLFEGRQTPGTYSIKWNGLSQSGSRAGNGVYICRLVLGNRTFVKRMTLLR
ncbi:T9SS type A sorting domain-containing protein [candidate division TA06 bacterium]|nr:T9SS type A sorting domain-containing protein [candidate division TA06 bacterium]